MALVNPISIKAAQTAVTNGIGPLIKHASAALPTLGQMFSRVDTGKMAKTISDHPQLAAGAQRCKQKCMEILKSMRQSDSFKELYSQAMQLFQDVGISHIGSERRNQKAECRKNLFPPGLDTASLSRETFSGMVGQQQWHVIQSERGRVTQTDWSGADKDGLKKCQTWEPSSQKTWNWTQKQDGKMIAIDAGEQLKGGITKHQAYLYRAEGEVPQHVTFYTDANGNAVPAPGNSGDHQQHGTSGIAEQRETPSAVIEEIKDDIETHKKSPKQIEPAPSQSQALLRKPVAGGVS